MSRWLIALLMGMVLAAARPSLAAEQTNSPLSPEWGTGFMTCDGANARSPALFKVANPGRNQEIQASGIIKCTDDGDAYVYTVDYINFALSPATDWPSAHLEWLGCGAQRSAGGGRNRLGPEWLYDEAKPIKVVIRKGVKRVAITGLSFRVPKSVLSQAHGFGFYVVGGGALWSIVFL